MFFGAWVPSSNIYPCWCFDMTNISIIWHSGNVFFINHVKKGHVEWQELIGHLNKPFTGGLTEPLAMWGAAGKPVGKNIDVHYGDCVSKYLAIYIFIRHRASSAFIWNHLYIQSSLSFSLSFGLHRLVSYSVVAKSSTILTSLLLTSCLANYEHRKNRIASCYIISTCMPFICST